MKMKKEQRLLFYIILSLSLAGLFQISIIPVKGDLAIGDDDPIYILSGDIIENFKFESFAGVEIDPITQDAYGGKLKFEIGPDWRVSQDDIDLLYTTQVEDEIYMYYKVRMTNTANIYTSIGINQVVEKIQSSSDILRGMDYCRIGLFGGSCIESKIWNFFFNNYRFWEGTDPTWIDQAIPSKLISYNTEHNKFSGPLIMSFDIDQSPLPNIFTDEAGNELTKDFDYISVSSITTEDVGTGKLSEDLPEITGLTPENFDSDTGTGGSTTNFAPQYTGDGTLIPININPYVAPTYVAHTFSPLMQHQSVGTTLNPTDKNGDPIFNAKEQEDSMENCSFVFNINSLGPVAFEYHANAIYTHYDVTSNDQWFAEPAWDIVPTSRSTPRPVAVHVQNRFMQPKFEIIFNIWTKYNVEVLETDITPPGVENPYGYYDNLSWLASVSGIGNGQIYREERTGFLEGLLDSIFGDAGSLLIFIVIIAIVVLAIILLPRLIPKRGPKPIQPTPQTFIQPGFTQPPPGQFQLISPTLGFAEETIREQQKLIKRQQKQIEKQQKEAQKQARRRDQQFQF